MRTHRATFYSPGTFVSEATSRPVDAWYPSLATAMAWEIKERHGATPFGFRFSTVIQHDDIPDDEGGLLTVKPREVERSGIHFITGRIMRLDDLIDSKNPEHKILISNMQINDYPLVIVNDNSYRSTHPFREEDVLVDWDGTVLDRGDRQDYVAYRAAKKAAHDAEREEWRIQYEARQEV